MLSDALRVMACPLCREALEIERVETELSDGSIVEATLVCRGCREQFPVQDRIPRMLHRRLPGIESKLREVDGWVSISKQQGWYVPDDAVDAVLPYVCRDLGWRDSTWQANEYSFSVFLDSYVKRGARILEVGAAKCWGAQHITNRGCDYFAVDILADPNIGLGRGSFYANLAGHFERVQADGERLPFADGSFDIAYCVASLHHALDVRAMLREMARVTKHGGVVAALNEGTRPIGWSGDAALQQPEKQHGINEHVHSLWSYLWDFTRCGLAVERLDHSNGYEGLALHRVAGKLLRLPRGKIWSTLYANSFIDYLGASFYARRI